MPTVADRVHDLPRLESLPERPTRHRPIRSAAGEPPADEQAHGSSRSSSASERPRLPRVLAGIRVLVVDDDEDTADLFATACGADVATASSATEALRVLAARPPDVVVSDIAMPGADGYWLLREIRQTADARVRSVPVVAVTAFGREHSHARALGAGFADRLEKPLDPEVLCLTVARVRTP